MTEGALGLVTLVQERSEELGFWVRGVKEKRLSGKESSRATNCCGIYPVGCCPIPLWADLYGMLHRWATLALVSA